MIRFRNPSSSLETMFASFDVLYEELKDKYYFDNDDIAKVLTKTNLMASSGFTGEQALSRGANTNKSRDKTYNNAKMFAEIFRLLGLISVVNNKSSNYRFTFIGQHMAALGSDKKALIEQCVLGINNPNRIIDVSYDESVRFFSCVLLTMDEMDGCLCRDEMILGPMCVNDNDTDAFNAMLQYLKSIRGNQSRLKNDLQELAKSLKDNKSSGMSVNSVRNCTRFPISVLKYCGWVDSQNLKIYGRSITFMVLTEKGKKVVEELKNLCDVRLGDYDASTNEQRKALIRLGVYSMLGRANFDLNDVATKIAEAADICNELLQGREILFSPYQTIEYATVNDALFVYEDEIEYSSDAVRDHVATNYAPEESILRPSDIVIETKVSIDGNRVTQNTEKFVDSVKQLYSGGRDIDEIIEIIVSDHIGDKKEEFYPLVETLFRIIGVDCHKSRDGVNGERWDAMIRDPEKSIPIEIKSPTEEMHLSVKAIRQALENKIILLSRETYCTTPDTSSYAVGYLLPNNRAEVFELIENIKKTFGYSIAVFDIATLVKIAVNIILLDKGIDKEELYRLEGIVNA